MAWCLLLLHVILPWTTGSSDVLPSLKFDVEPPSVVRFLNSSGTTVPCSVAGAPSVLWKKSDGSPVISLTGLRTLQPDGSLIFHPFRAEDYREDVHSAVYRCVASSTEGTLGSRDVKVNAVLASPIEVSVEDGFVSLHNTAVVRCHIPNHVKTHVVLSDWYSDDGLTFSVTGLNAGGSYSRYQALQSGLLHIANVAPSDGARKYGCKVKNLLTREIVKSSALGKLIISEANEKYPPRFVEESNKWLYNEGQTAALPCVAHGNPMPQYRWYRLDAGRLRHLPVGHRSEVRDGTLIIGRVTSGDTGNYICVANNSFGQGRIERELIVTAPLSIQVLPIRLCVTLGEDVTINCSVSGGPIEGISWVKDQRPLMITNRIRQLSVQVLHIRSFRSEDTGFYQCYAFNSYDSAQGSTELCQKAESPVFQSIFGKQLVMPGQSVSLKCVASGWPVPQIQWHLDGAPIPDGGHVIFGDYVYSNGSVASFVNITKVSVHDGGVYNCEAINSVGVVIHSARLDVFGPPIVKYSRNVTVAASESVVITCPVAGYPIKDIYLEKGNRRLPYNERQTFPEQGTLHIYGVRKDDEGYYKCIVVSGRGERAEGNLILQVVTAPVISPFSFPTTLQEGMRISATCTVIAGDPPVLIRWSKDYQPVQHVGSEVEVVPITEFVSSLIINKIRRQHSGNYTCTASNHVASVNMTAKMIVHAAPQWSLAPSDKVSVAGTPVLFDCQAVGEPMPVVRWKRQEDKKDGSYHNILSSPHVHVLENGSLYITSAEKVDQGYYLCEVTNGIGENLRAKVKLTVHTLPRIHAESRSVKVKRGDKVTLTCTATGDQPLTVVWRKEGIPIHAHGNSRYMNQESNNEISKISRLSLLTTEREDSSLFTCLVTNPYGEDKVDVNVIIQESPDSPENIRSQDVTSSSVTLTWKPPFSGNLPITSYYVAFRTESEQWDDERRKEHRVAGNELFMTLTDLEPMTTYYVQITAENSMGRSSASAQIAVTTRKGAPRYTPEEVTVMALNSTAVKVSWKVGKEAREQQQLVDGYYIGYQDSSSNEKFVYNTVDMKKGPKYEDFVISNLRRYTRYKIIVQAFNSEGAGPASNEIVVQTYEYDPPSQPVLIAKDVTTSSVLLSWEIPGHGNPINGYVIRYKYSISKDWHEQSDGVGKTEWNEVHVSSHKFAYLLDNLRCGTNYALTITAFNNVGNGDASNTVHVTTSGKAPIAPEKTQMLRYNSTFVWLNLRTWTHNGCPISHFSVQYKPQTDREWILASSYILGTEESLSIGDLYPGTWYDLLVSAQSDAGSTEAEFRFATLTIYGATVPPLPIATITRAPFFEDPTLLVPIICAVVVLVVIIIVTAVVIAWRRRDAAAETAEICSRTSVGRGGDNISMCSYGKGKGNSIYGQQREPLYYPSPYASSHVVAGGGQSDLPPHPAAFTTSLRRHHGRTTEHVYDIPHRPQQRPEQYSSNQYTRLWTNNRNGLRLSVMSEKKEDEALVLAGTANLIRRSLSVSYHSDASDSPTNDDGRCLATRLEEDTSELDGFSETECDRDHTMNRRYFTSDLLPESIIVMC